MTGRETLHRLVDELSDEQADLARALLEDLRDAPDPDSPLEASTVASLERGLADIAAGHTMPLEEYGRERRL